MFVFPKCVIKICCSILKIVLTDIRSDISGDEINTDLKTLIRPSNKIHLNNWDEAQSSACVATAIYAYIINGVNLNKCLFSNNDDAAAMILKYSIAKNLNK